MFVDYHTHHYRCGHAVGTLREYVEQAVKLKLDQIGLSDHMPIIHLPKGKKLEGIGMEVFEIEKYVSEALALKEEYKKDIDIKVGLEADYIPKYEKEIEKLLSPYPFDYLIGSVHFLGEWDFSDSRQISGWRKRSVDDIFEEYFYTVENAAKSGLYNIVGHFDVVKKFGHNPRKNMDPVIKQTLKSIKESDMVMEINTSGLRIVNEIYPSPKILKQAVEMGIDFTFGSDAHKPEDVFWGIENAGELLKELGVNKIATFEKRLKKMVSLI